MRTRVCIAAVMLAATAGCSSGSEKPVGSASWNEGTPTPSATLPTPPSARAVVIAKGDVCQPPGVPGNCWLPLYPQPALTGTAYNQSAVCNNGSRDQSSCWPQPDTEVEVVCTTQGSDGRQWYGVRVPPERMVASSAQHIHTDGPIGYAAAQYLWVRGGEALNSLPDCSNLN
ncbi:MAG TPA: hypothetical protein VLA88_05675 [Candidatus Saccharimonadales bacterium]|nr:hypothetical protein [Candidatus Saccharimonadales bacterium]